MPSSQLCEEIDQHDKNTPDMIEDEKKKIPGTWRTVNCGKLVISR